MSSKSTIEKSIGSVFVIIVVLWLLWAHMSDLRHQKEKPLHIPMKGMGYWKSNGSDVDRGIKEDYIVNGKECGTVYESEGLWSVYASGARGAGGTYDSITKAESVVIADCDGGKQ